jgi:hypothetical protein
MKSQMTSRALGTLGTDHAPENDNPKSAIKKRVSIVARPVKMKPQKRKKLLLHRSKALKLTLWSQGLKSVWSTKLKPKQKNSLKCHRSSVREKINNLFKLSLKRESPNVPTRKFLRSQRCKIQNQTTRIVHKKSLQRLQNSKNWKKMILILSERNLLQLAKFKRKNRAGDQNVWLRRMSVQTTPSRPKRKK